MVRCLLHRLRAVTDYRLSPADTTRKIAESLSPAPKKRDKLSALPERTSSTISSSAPTISVTRKQHMNLYDLSDSSEQDGEAMQSKSTSVTSEASISKSPPQLPKRALAEPDDHAEQPGVASKRAKNGHAGQFRLFSTALLLTDARPTQMDPMSISRSFRAPLALILPSLRRQRARSAATASPPTARTRARGRSCR